MSEMLGIKFWVRRTWPGFLLCGGAVAMTMMRSHEWIDWWQWMVSTVNGSAMLLSPLAAALACFRVIRGWRSDTRAGLLPSASLRGLLDIGVATLLQAWTAMAAGAVVGVLTCHYAHARSGFMEWPGQAVVGAIAVVPAVGVGLLAGCLSESAVTVASTFVAVFLSHLLLWDVVGPQFFSPDLPTASMWGYKLAPTRLYWEIFGNLGLATFCLGMLIFLCNFGRQKRLYAAMVAATGLGMAIAAWIAVAKHPRYYVLMVPLQ